MIKRATYLSLLLAVNVQVQASVTVNVVGLFPDAAVIVVDGQRHFLKTGQSKDGIKLVSTGNNNAVVEINGKKQTLNLGRERADGFTAAPQKKDASLIRSNDGHYWANGKINGRTVRMVVDTGASDISLSEATAKQLGISYRNGTRARYQTANGTVVGYQITLSSVTVETITLNNVKASVVPSNHPILLGMSFLREVDMREQGNMLYLVPRY
ncbi:retropepsin-like aspartic protease family protein [Sansalvadorimonas verongulae]|uniref:retropepsin-like aspartic protease family protein n=1 Tax=Sansalvadorimonas verongulae TaxID=2172824 RepID=UPI0012BD04DB|nr:TIGR02281 family clan AA aspartic protease [Sansalvadorimonas verongulae]MTI14487.1 TIGR02281 family clan AA aspartic protease [Sansalvadorimonas verongulae]